MPFGATRNSGLDPYHKMLREFKEKYESMVPAQYGQFYDADPEDNIFAKFHYECTRHTHWGDSALAGHGVWYLLWDPTLTGDAAPRNATHGHPTFTTSPGR